VATTAARPPLPYVLAEIDDEWLATDRRYLTWEDRASTMRPSASARSAPEGVVEGAVGRLDAQVLVEHQERLAHRIDDVLGEGPGLRIMRSVYNVPSHGASAYTTGIERRTPADEPLKVVSSDMV
jgi:hypothetical protein